MEEEGEESGDGDDDEDADDKDDADLADLRKLYTETIGKSARGALANDAARLAKAIVAKQEADAAEKERIEEERTAKYDAAADARKWDRMAINSATAKNAMQRRVAVLLETGVAPLCLRGSSAAAADSFAAVAFAVRVSCVPSLCHGSWFVRRSGLTQSSCRGIFFSLEGAGQPERGRSWSALNHTKSSAERTGSSSGAKSLKSGKVGSCSESAACRTPTRKARFQRSTSSQQV